MWKRGVEGSGEIQVNQVRLLSLWGLLFLSSCCGGALAQDPLAGDVGEDDLDAELDLEGGGIVSLRGEARRKEIARILAKPSEDHFRDLCHILRADLDKRQIEDKAFAVLLRFGGGPLVPIGKALLQHPILYKQVMGVRLLGASGSKDAVPALLDVARTDRPKHAELRYRLICALTDLGDPSCLPWLRKTAEGDSFARLALGVLDDYSRLTEILRDHDVVQRELKELLHNMNVLAAYMSPAQKREAAKRAEKYRDYVRRFRSLIASFGPAQVQTVASYLADSPGTSLIDILYVAIPGLVTKENAANLLPLLEAQNPELLQETARALADVGDASVLGEVQKVLQRRSQSESSQDRALAARVADLFPEPDQNLILRQGLGDQSAYVVVEALKTIVERRVMGFSKELRALRADPRHQPNFRIQQLVEEAQWLQAQVATKQTQ